MAIDPKTLTPTEKVEAACRQVARAVLERARETGTPVIVWEEGHPVERSVEELDGRSSPLCVE